MPQGRELYYLHPMSYVELWLGLVGSCGIIKKMLKAQREKGVNWDECVKP